MRLLFAFAGNEGHLQPMRYLVLSPFPPSKGDHVDPLGPTTHFFQFDQEPRLSAASSLLDQLAGRPTTSGVFSAFYTNGGLRSRRVWPAGQRNQLSGAITPARARSRSTAL